MIKMKDLMPRIFADVRSLRIRQVCKWIDTLFEQNKLLCFEILIYIVKHQSMDSVPLRIVEQIFYTDKQIFNSVFQSAYHNIRPCVELFEVMYNQLYHASDASEHLDLPTITTQTELLDVVTELTVLPNLIKNRHDKIVRHMIDYVCDKYSADKIYFVDAFRGDVWGSDGILLIMLFNSVYLGNTEIASYVCDRMKSRVNKSSRLFREMIFIGVTLAVAQSGNVELFDCVRDVLHNPEILWASIIVGETKLFVHAYDLYKETLSPAQLFNLVRFGIIYRNNEVVQRLLQSRYVRRILRTEHTYHLKTYVPPFQTADLTSTYGRRIRYLYEKNS